eukprot:2389732-Amphidinium_carterae.1
MFEEDQLNQNEGKRFLGRIKRFFGGAHLNRLLVPHVYTVLRLLRRCGRHAAYGRETKDDSVGFMCEGKASGYGFIDCPEARARSSVTDTKPTLYTSAVCVELKVDYMAAHLVVAFWMHVCWAAQLGRCELDI